MLAVLAAQQEDAAVAGRGEDVGDPGLALVLDYSSAREVGTVPRQMRAMGMQSVLPSQASEH